MESKPGDRPRFYLDEHVPKAVAIQLRLREVNLVRCQEIGLREASDLEHMERASHDGRVVVGRDKDFARLHRDWMSQGLAHPGIILLEKGLSIGQVVFVIELFSQALSAAEMRSRIWYASEFVVR